MVAGVGWLRPHLRHQTRVGTRTDWATVSAGLAFSCALTTSGTRYCWGDNEFGQLGIGDTIDRNRPIRWTGDARWASISLGDSHACAIHVDGSLACWGDNGYGQLGTGDFTERNLPTPVG